MAITVKIKLAAWKDEPAQKYTVDNSHQLGDLLYNLLGTAFATRDPHAMLSRQGKGNRKFIAISCGDEVTITMDRDYQTIQEFQEEVWSIFLSKYAASNSFKDFLKKIFNPFRWLRHGLTFAVLTTVIGVGLSFSAPALVTVLAALLAVGVGAGASSLTLLFLEKRGVLLAVAIPSVLAIAIAIGFSFLKPDLLGAAMPALAGITALGATIGLPMLILMGLIETILEYRQARHDIRSHAYAANYYIDYGFFSYLYDVVKYWGPKHKGQAAIVGVGIGLFILAILFTVPYCVDPAGSFSFMSTILDPIVRFFSQSIDVLAAMPQFEFLNGIQPLALAGGLLISSTLAVPLTLKNLVQGLFDVQDAAYHYEEEDGERQEEIDNAYDPNNPDNGPNYKQFCSNGFFVTDQSPYSLSLSDMNKICEHERELVIR